MDRLGVVLMSAVLLQACASQIPEQVRSASPPSTRSLSDARVAPKRFNGEHVRWGGTIAAVENRESQTWIEVARCHLSNNGTPEETHRGGRFLALIDRELDPNVYSEGRQLTVVGDLEEGNSGAINEYDDEHPVVNVTTHYLWAPSASGRDSLGAALGAHSRMPMARIPMFFRLFY